jgi:predicted anti-sigma-YlaC factor YlaD
MGDKLKVKYFIDLVMLITLLITAFTGFVISGTVSFVAVDRHFWFLTHDFFGITTVVLILIHIALHLDWIKSSTKKIFGRENKK